MTGTQTWFDRDAAGNLVHETRNNGRTICITIMMPVAASVLSTTMG